MGLAKLELFLPVLADFCSLLRAFFLAAKHVVSLNKQIGALSTPLSLLVLYLIGTAFILDILDKRTLTNIEKQHNN